MALKRTIRVVIGDPTRSAGTKVAILTLLVGIWVGGAAILIYGFTQPADPGRGWVIVGFWLLVAAFVASRPSWYRRWR